MEPKLEVLNMASNGFLWCTKSFQKMNLLTCTAVKITNQIDGSKMLNPVFSLMAYTEITQNHVIVTLVRSSAVIASDTGVPTGPPDVGHSHLPKRDGRAYTRRRRRHSRSTTSRPKSIIEKGALGVVFLARPKTIKNHFSKQLLLLALQGKPAEVYPGKV